MFNDIPDNNDNDRTIRSIDDLLVAITTDKTDACTAKVRDWATFQSDPLYEVMQYVHWHIEQIDNQCHDDIIHGIEVVLVKLFRNWPTYGDMLELDHLVNQLYEYDIDSINEQYNDQFGRVRAVIGEAIRKIQNDEI